MNPLEQIITGRIRRDGPITFETFMDMALYYPGLGYYTAHRTTLGREGDFYTSPHLHSIFGAMIARQLIEMWEIMGRIPAFNAVEMGAGEGHLCKDIFDYLIRHAEDADLQRRKTDFLKALRYTIVEPYSHFEERQKSLLTGLRNSPSLHSSGESQVHDITWLKSLKDLSSIEGCLFSNELIDAFPVHIVEIDNGLCEIYVHHSGSEITEEKGPVSAQEIITCLSDFSDKLPQGYRTEVNLRIRRWMEDVANILPRGFLLTIDYGYTAREYYSDERSTGTLLCYHKHLFNENPYQNIGEQDITAHVNFSSLKRWGGDLGLKTLGYCGQGTYMIASGINEVIAELYSGSPDYLSEVSNIKRLIMPQGMGESHRVMVQYKGEGTPELRGFSMRNLLESL